MAVYRTDRERRMAGDRLLAKRAAMSSLHGVVGDLLDAFEAAHHRLQRALEQRRFEELQDAAARSERNAAEERAMLVLNACWRRLPALIQPDPIRPAPPAELKLARRTFFPLGSPRELTRSTQMVLDGVSHLARAMERIPAPAFPAELVTAVRETRDRLACAVDAAARERQQSATTMRAHDAAREAWDRSVRAMRLIVLGFLVLAGREQEFKSFFTPLPSKAAGGPTDRGARKRNDERVPPAAEVEAEVAEAEGTGSSEPPVATGTGEAALPSSQGESPAPPEDVSKTAA